MESSSSLARLVILLALLTVRQAYAQSNEVTGQLVGYQPTTNNTAVCVVVWPPHVIQTGGQLSGYQYDLWAEAAKWLGGIPYTVTVLPDIATAKKALLLPKSNPSHCDVMLTNWANNVDDAALGIKASTDTFRGGYQLVIRGSNKPVQTWSFVTIFSWDLWLALFLTAILLTPFFFYAELDFFRRGLGKTRFPKQVGTGLIESFYRTTGKLINVVDELRVTSIVSKAVALTWGMLATILLSVYTAGLTARTTRANFASSIQSVADLPNMQVGTPTDATHHFLRYGWIGVPLGPFTSDADGQAMLDQLTAPNSTLDALVLDASWVAYHLANRCDVLVIGGVVQYQHTSFALSPYMDFALRYNLTVALVDLNSVGMQDQLVDKYMGKQSCGVTNTIALQVLGVQDTAGMWIVVASLVGLAVLLVLIAWVKPAWDIDVWHVSLSSKSMRSLTSALPRGLAASNNDLSKQSYNDGLSTRPSQGP